MLFDWLLRGGFRPLLPNIKECKLCSYNDFCKHPSHTLPEPKSLTVQYSPSDEIGLQSSLSSGMRNQLMT